MKLTLFLLFFFQVLFSYSQSNWAEIGTKWWYEQVVWGPPNGTPYNKIEVIKDTIINNRTVKKLDWKTYYTAGVPTQKPSLYTFEDAGKIYFIFEDDSLEYKMYDFSAQVGDTVTIYPKFFSGVIDSFQVIIDSIKAENFNGITKDVFYNSPVIQANYTFGNWIHNIGSDYNFLPQPGTVDPPDFGAIRCYEDATTGLLKFSNKTCDTIGVGIELAPDSNFKITIYPNPAKNKTTIAWKLPVDNAILSIKDITGKQIINIKIQGKEGNWQWDTRKILKGMYFYEIRTTDEKLASGNIAVQH